MNLSLSLNYLFSFSAISKLSAIDLGIGNQQCCKISLELLKSRLDSLGDGWADAKNKGTAPVLLLVVVASITMFTCIGERKLDADL